MCFVRSDAHTYTRTHTHEWTCAHSLACGSDLVVQWSLSDLQEFQIWLLLTGTYVPMYNDLLTGLQGCFRQSPLQPHRPTSGSHHYSHTGLLQAVTTTATQGGFRQSPLQPHRARQSPLQPHRARQSPLQPHRPASGSHHYSHTGLLQAVTTTATQGCFRQSPLQPHSMEWRGYPTVTHPEY